ncbi:RNA helicase [Endozoicomonas sp. (ex Bugula neritina AB1)]|nr:RNA helicase [Endozoicomonas sp. (ex Bugula neritina AB1)]
MRHPFAFPEEHPLLFSDLALNERLQKALNELGFDKATPVQEQTFPKVLEGKDLMVSAETGSGKTAAFLLPILNHLQSNPAPKSSTRALILVPTRELAQQILAECEKLARYTFIKAGMIIGGESFRHQINTFRKNPEILIVTPGRLIEHMENSNHDFSDLEYLVLDEADRMLDMGFGGDVLRITDECNDDRQAMLFSATLESRSIKDMIDHVLNEPQSLILSTARDKHANIHQQIILADDTKHKERLLIWLLQNETYEKALIFCNTIVQAQDFYGKIRVKGLNVGILHGDMDQRERKHVMRLLADGKFNILIATDVAARGLDIKGVQLVVNLDLARNGDDYVHRIGRTGRAGEEGLAISLIGPPEWDLMTGIQRYVNVSFEKRSIKELRGTFKGPKKLKSSGKAAGPKKKGSKKTKIAAKKAESEKQRKRVKKNIGKRRPPSENTANAPVSAPVDSGFEPPKRKK